MKPYATALLLACLAWMSNASAACTQAFKPVCGYWPHTPKTQTFVNECQAREFGAKVRHEGSCKDQPSKAPAASAPAKK